MAQTVPLHPTHIANDASIGQVTDATLPAAGVSRRRKKNFERTDNSFQNELVGRREWCDCSVVRRQRGATAAWCDGSVVRRQRGATAAWCDCVLAGPSNSFQERVGVGRG